MDGSIDLIPSERKTLLEYYRKSTDPAVRLRAHVLLLAGRRPLVEPNCGDVVHQHQYDCPLERPV